MTYPALPKKLVGGQRIPQWFSSFDPSYLTSSNFLGDATAMMLRPDTRHPMIDSMSTEGGGQIAVHGPFTKPQIIGLRLAMIVSDPGGRIIL